MLICILFVFLCYVGVRIAGSIILLRNPVVVSNEEESKESTIVIEPGQPGLTLNVRGANVDVRRSETAKEISVVVNDASQWSVTGGQITQTKFNGINYELGALSLTMSGTFSFPLLRDLYNIWAVITGKPVCNKIVLLPTSTLVVTVPADYTGDFDGNFSGSGTFNLESWTGGNVNLQYGASGNAVIGSLKGLKTFVLNQSGFGAVSLSDIESSTIAINCDGSGNLNLNERVTAGSITMAVTSFGDVTIKQDISAPEGFVLRMDGSGDVSFERTLSAGVFDVRLSSFGALILGEVNVRNLSTYISGSGNITVRNVTSENGVVIIDLSSFGEMKARSIRAGKVEITVTGSGDVDVDSIQANDVDARLTSFGSITAAQLNVERLDVRCSGSGDFTATGSANRGNIDRSSFGDVKLKGQFNCN